jgi:hypothetical protein
MIMIASARLQATWLNKASSVRLRLAALASGNAQLNGTDQGAAAWIRRRIP